MKFEILNVQHGFAAYAIAEDDSVFLFDCGHSSTCRPSDLLWAQGIKTIRRLIVTNYDEDHIGDLPRLREKFTIEILTRNASLTAAQLRNLKTAPVSVAMNTLLDMIDNFTGEVSREQLEPPGLKMQMFWNRHPAFTDTNNLSLLNFLDIGDVSFVLPGDLERAGWIKLLENPSVRESLGRVHIFVASHHGRESGYCSEVFDYCHPQFVVMSDGPVEHDTQKMASRYGQHASGGWFNGLSGREWRKVLTTRKDGNLLWQSG